MFSAPCLCPLIPCWKNRAHGSSSTLLYPIVAERWHQRPVDSRWCRQRQDHDDDHAHLRDIKALAVSSWIRYTVLFLLPEHLLEYERRSCYLEGSYISIGQSWETLTTNSPRTIQGGGETAVRRSECALCIAWYAEAVSAEVKFSENLPDSRRPR
jgi:hypothetical protein